MTVNRSIYIVFQQVTLVVCTRTEPLCKIGQSAVCAHANEIIQISREQLSRSAAFADTRRAKRSSRDIGSSHLWPYFSTTYRMSNEARRIPTGVCGCTRPSCRQHCLKLGSRAPRRCDLRPLTISVAGFFSHRYRRHHRVD
jgi:hypothetical protein